MNWGSPAGFIQEWFFFLSFEIFGIEKLDKRRKPLKGKNNYGGNWQKRSWMLTSKSVE